MKSITTRQLQDRTVNAIITEATKRGAHAAPVFNHKGQIEEVHLFRDGALHSSISRPDAGRIWVWRPDRSPYSVDDIPEAVRVGLFALQEPTKQRVSEASLQKTSSVAASS